MSNENPADSAAQSTGTSGPASGGPGVQSDGETYRLASPSPMIGDPDSPPVLTPIHTVGRRTPKRSKLRDYWARWGYNGLVFVTSICVMTLELTASRLIQKSVGSSLYTWTSVIGVVLAGITLGNFLGGWLADRFDRGRTLAWMYLFGSVACASVLWLDQLVAPLSRPSSISLPTWVLTVVATMFLLPSLALGTISPLVASMALSRTSRTGATVGNVYAWGALGSIIGTFLTGFYLMDEFGTRTIIGLTSGTLGVLAVIVAGAPRLFRVAVICGWLQLLGWTFLAATCTEKSLAAASDALGAIATMAEPHPQAAITQEAWSVFGRALGTKFHELGLLLKLRDDRIGAYYDESSYSTIQITEGTVRDGENRSHTVKHLRLDKLIHSYFDPANPTRLYYEYEQIYAAVTKRTAARMIQPVSLSIKSLPDDDIANRLPSGASLDVATRTLQIDQPTAEIFDALLALAPDADVWHAIEQLYAETNRPLWGGFSSVVVDQVPEGFIFPEDAKNLVLFDRSLGRITAYDVLSAELRDRLIDSTPLSTWYREVQRARGLSRRATSLFIGGGGFIFPRWFLKEFPGSPRVEVAELDPAVYRAAVEGMGLSSADQQRIITTIGDARNVIDDRLRDNRRLVASGSPPIRFDFIYGDAFNDFSVPAHLTTREFIQKVNDLLTDDGVFLANLIDIYPRFEYPGTTLAQGETIYQGPLPIGLNENRNFGGRYEPAGSNYAPLEIKNGGGGSYWIRAKRTILPDEQSRLEQSSWPEIPGNEGAVEGFQSAWSSAVSQVASQTQTKRPYQGSLPTGLLAVEGPIGAWRPVPAPWGFVETCDLGNNHLVLGFRGLISQQLQKELADLDPRNEEWQAAVRNVSVRSRRPGPGRFLGRFVATAADVFPNIYLFSTASSLPGSSRDTFVLVCSRQPLDLRRLQETGDWNGEWFAAMETLPGHTEPEYAGQMSAVLSLAEGHLLTDDFVPVDNLLRPVFNDQH